MKAPISHFKINPLIRLLFAWTWLHVKIYLVLLLIQKLCS
jgi:hypothetical protein